MFEVKVHINVFEGNRVVAHTFTIATFVAHEKAIAFAKQIDKGFGVTVQNVEDEDNRDKNFGLVYDRTPAS